MLDELNWPPKAVYKRPINTRLKLISRPATNAEIKSFSDGMR
jgi:hypothetical protein